MAAALRRALGVPDLQGTSGHRHTRMVNARAWDRRGTPPTWSCRRGPAAPPTCRRAPRRGPARGPARPRGRTSGAPAAAPTGRWSARRAAGGSRRRAARPGGPPCSTAFAASSLVTCTMAEARPGWVASATAATARRASGDVRQAGEQQLGAAHLRGGGGEAHQQERDVVRGRGRHRPRSAGRPRAPRARRRRRPVSSRAASRAMPSSTSTSRDSTSPSVYAASTLPGGNGVTSSANGPMPRPSGGPGGGSTRCTRPPGSRTSTGG